MRAQLSWSVWSPSTSIISISEYPRVFSSWIRFQRYRCYAVHASRSMNRSRINWFDRVGIIVIVQCTLEYWLSRYRSLPVITRISIAVPVAHRSFRSCRYYRSSFGIPLTDWSWMAGSSGRGLFSKTVVQPVLGTESPYTDLCTDCTSIVSIVPVLSRLSYSIQSTGRFWMESSAAQGLLSSMPGWAVGSRVWFPQYRSHIGRFDRVGIIVCRTVHHWSVDGSWMESSSAHRLSSRMEYQA